MKTKLHIVSFDAPFPANYGGVIDVFERIKELYKLDIEIYLHCFIYKGKTAQVELKKYCKEVFYYPRKQGLQGVSFNFPYIISSRKNKNLLKNLIEIDAPILFEGIHTCYFINHPFLKNRNKIVRMHNVEQDYYKQLSKIETSFFKRTYYKIEAHLISKFEKKLEAANSIVCISLNDEAYFKKVFPQKKVIFLPSSNLDKQVEIKPGLGNYCFYHGNLSVAENINSIKFLIEEVLINQEHILIIAGSNASKSFIKYISKFHFVSLIENPNDEKMKELLQNAQIHVLPTFQNTGLKLKLINSLFTARFVLCNSAMVNGSNLESICYIANSVAHFQQRINELMQKEITETEIEHRKKVLNDVINNKENFQKFIELFM